VPLAAQFANQRDATAYGRSNVERRFIDEILCARSRNQSSIQDLRVSRYQPHGRLRGVGAAPFLRSGLSVMATQVVNLTYIFISQQLRTITSDL